MGAAGLCGASLCSPTEVVSALVVTPELAVAPGSYKAPAAELLRGRSITPPLPAVAMAKGRVAERSQTGPLQTTPPGDRAAGTQGPTAPGGRDHLKGEWIQGPELGLVQRRECAGRGSGGEQTPAGF